MALLESLNIKNHWVRWLLYFTISQYIVVNFGQEFFEVGSFARKYFVFVGKSWTFLLLSIVLYKVWSNGATKFAVGLFSANVINNMFFLGEYSYIEFLAIIIGLIYLSLK